MKNLLQIVFVITATIQFSGCAMLGDPRSALGLGAPEKKTKRTRSPASAEGFSQNPDSPPVTDRRYEPLDLPKRVKKTDFSADAGGDGSLWSDRGQVNYFFSKNKARQIGDVLTVGVESSLRNEILAVLRSNTVPTEWEMRRKAREAKKKALARKRAAAQGARAPAAKGKTPAPAAAAAKKPGESAEDKELKDRKAQEEKDVSKENDIVNVEVLDRFDNGNYRVRGIKEVVFRGKRHKLEVTGIVREADISDEENISSAKMMTPRVEYLQ